MENLHNKTIGAIGEKIAIDLMLQKGYVLLAKNYTTHWGEIDSIFRNNNKVVFVEVKTKIGIGKGKPYEAVNVHKLKHLMRPIQSYILEHRLQNMKQTLCVVSIVLDSNRNPIEMKLYEDIISY